MWATTKGKTKNNNNNNNTEPPSLQRPHPISEYEYKNERMTIHDTERGKTKDRWATALYFYGASWREGRKKGRKEGKGFILIASRCILQLWWNTSQTQSTKSSYNSVLTMGPWSMFHERITTPQQTFSSAPCFLFTSCSSHACCHGYSTSTHLFWGCWPQNSKCAWMYIPLFIHTP